MDKNIKLGLLPILQYLVDYLTTLKNIIPQDQLGTAQYVTT